MINKEDILAILKDWDVRIAQYQALDDPWAEPYNLAYLHALKECKLELEYCLTKQQPQ